MSQTEKDPALEKPAEKGSRNFSCGYDIPCCYCGWLLVDHKELLGAVSEADLVTIKKGYHISLSTCISTIDYFPEDMDEWLYRHQAQGK